MKCEECNEIKENQKYPDVCDWCVNKLMKKLWDEELGPKIKNFIDRAKKEIKCLKVKT